MQKGVKRKQYGGWTPKPKEERLVQIFSSVKRKNLKTAEKAMKELLKQWR